MKYEFNKVIVDENISVSSAILYSEDGNCGCTKKVNTCPVVNDKCKH